MAFLRKAFLRENGTNKKELPTVAPTAAAYTRWKARNYSVGKGRINKRYSMKGFAEYYKVLKKTNKFPIS